MKKSSLIGFVSLIMLLVGCANNTDVDTTKVVSEDVLVSSNEESELTTEETTIEQVETETNSEYKEFYDKVQVMFAERTNNVTYDASEYGRIASDGNGYILQTDDMYTPIYVLSNNITTPTYDKMSKVWTYLGTLNIDITQLQEKTGLDFQVNAPEEGYKQAFFTKENASASSTTLIYDLVDKQAKDANTIQYNKFFEGSDWFDNGYSAGGILTDKNVEVYVMLSQYGLEENKKVGIESLTAYVSLKDIIGQDLYMEITYMPFMEDNTNVDALKGIFDFINIQNVSE